MKIIKNIIYGIFVLILITTGVVLTFGLICCVIMYGGWFWTLAIAFILFLCYHIGDCYFYYKP